MKNGGFLAIIAVDELVHVWLVARVRTLPRSAHNVAERAEQLLSAFRIDAGMDGNVIQFNLIRLLVLSQQRKRKYLLDAE